MATFRFTWDNFAALAPRVADRLARAVLQQASHEIVKRWVPYVKAHTPVGGVLTRDRHPGLAKRSWRLTVMAEGAYSVKNPAAHAHIIDRGRRRGVTPVGATARVRAKHGQKLRPHPKARMLGSIQARSGMTRPTWKRINKAEREAISRIAVDRAEALVNTAEGTS